MRARSYFQRRGLQHGSRIALKPLEQSVTQDWIVGPDDREPVAPDTWEIGVPGVGSLEALRVGFGEALDQALALRMIGVMRG